MQVNIHEAKMHLSKLLHIVSEEGQEVIGHLLPPGPILLVA